MIKYNNCKNCGCIIPANQEKCSRCMDRERDEKIWEEEFSK